MSKSKSVVLSSVSKTVRSYEDEQKQKIKTACDNMSYRELLLFLQNEIEQSTRMSNFDHSIKCFKDDGIYALHRAIEKLVGVSKNKASSKPSGGEVPMNTVDIELADGRRIKVPYGEIQLPNMGEDASIDIFYDDSSHLLFLRGSCEYRFSSLIDSIVDLTKHLLNTDSIYKDMAIEVGSDFVPKRLDLSNIDQQFMILNAETEYALRPLTSRIQEPEMCIEKGIEIKTGILLEGRYGTGKTLLAFKIANEAIRNNWSFIYLKEPKLLAETLRLSKTLDNNGNGVIVFLEDIDQVTRGERDAAMQDILNTLDGGDTKGMNVILICTTNHIELINPTLLRGKRIGSIVSMGTLNADTAYKFIESAFEDGYMIETDGLEEVCQQIEEEGIVPAFMAEILDKVKANLIFEKTNTVTAQHISFSLAAYLRQVFLSQKQDMSETPEIKLAKALSDVISTHHNDKKIDTLIEELT